MQVALRSWLHRVAGGLCGMPAPALLSVLCASALSPLIATLPGIGYDTVIAGSGILSSFGSGILSGIITDTLEDARSKDAPQAPGEAGLSIGLDRLSSEVAAGIDRVLTAGGTNAMALQAELARLIAAVDESGTILRASLDEQGEHVRAVVQAAIGELGPHLAVIQSKLDAQGAGVQALVGHSLQQSSDIGVLREDIGVIRAGVAAIARRIGVTPAIADGSASDREVRQAQVPASHADSGQLSTGTPSPGVTMRRRRQLIGLATIIAAVMAGLASAALLLSRSPSGQAAPATALARSSPASSRCEPQISSVTPVNTAQPPHLIIKGTCFGTGGPITGDDSDYFEITDLDGNWTACSTYLNDTITCDITKWTPTSITLDGLAGSYGSQGTELNMDDRLIISVGNRQGSGAAGPKGTTGNCVVMAGQRGTTSCQPGCTPKIDSVSAFRAIRTPAVVIRGSCFGAFAGISSRFPDKNVPFFVVIDNSGGWAGCGIKNDGGGFGVTCTISYWSPRLIIFSGFGGWYGRPEYLLHKGDLLLIEVRNVRDDGLPGYCNVIVGRPATACPGDD